MIIHKGYENLSLSNPVVTLGIFDGVHLGHKAIISRLVTRSKSLDGESVIITFYPHPRIVLSEYNSSLSFLTSLEEKTAMLEKEGVDHLIIIPFDHDLSNKEACQFIEDVLVKKIGSKCLIVGFNHHFGKKSESDYRTIRQCAESFDIIVEQVEAVQTDLGIVSSSLIREALLSGKLEHANALLGYDYFINGKIAKGKQIGRKIGFPTANIVPAYKNKLIPKDGVYAVEVLINGSGNYGMLSIGTNPTLNNDLNNRTIEVNIFDFEEDIYNVKICVIFKRRIRDMIRFDDISLLIRQMENDKKIALGFLKE